MKLSTFFKLFLTAFTIGCGVLIWQTGIFCRGGHPTKGSIIPLAATTEEKPAAIPAEAADAQQNRAPSQQPQMSAALPPLEFSAVNVKEETVVLGELYEKIERYTDSDKYKFQIEFTNHGAAVKKVSLGEFSERDSSGKEPYVLFEPIQFAKTPEVPPSSCNNAFLPLYALANKKLHLELKSGEGLAEGSFPLDKLNWRVLRADKNEVVFEAVLGKVAEEGGRNIIKTPMVRIEKKYTISPGGYNMGCEIAMENLTQEPLYAGLEIQGTGKIRPDGFGMEDRSIKKAFLVDNKTVMTRAMPFSAVRSNEALRGSASTGFLSSLKALFGSKPQTPAEILTMPYSTDKDENKKASFLWVATTNKYFTAIVHPIAEGAQDAVTFSGAEYYDLDITSKKAAKDSSASYVLTTAEQVELPAAAAENNVRRFKMEVYWGPKDRELFSENAEFRSLDYIQTMDFNSCCCPQSLIGPLAFSLVWLMNTMYHWMGPWGNYGVVIIILVFLVRLLMHPLTKMGQVRMMKSQKLMPKFQEMQKRLGKDKTKMDPEMMAMNKQMMQAQMMGMMPMFIQMPIWIAVWTAVSINFDLRGQGFLPFWMTDLSAPDAVFRFTPFLIPLVGWEISSLNLLPLLMGFVMYLQMKMTPTAQATPANPEMAQQQKLMSVMMVGMFPIMLYNGPSGVNLYIMASMAAGVVEQYVIRKHLRQKQEEEEETLIPTTAKLGRVKKKKPKPMFRFDK
jgi:YidC/Oxa1 family membrane protein insertase